MSLFKLARGGIKLIKGADRKVVNLSERLFSGQSKVKRKMIEDSLPANASFKQKVAAADKMRFGAGGSRQNARAVTRMGYATAGAAGVSQLAGGNKNSKKTSKKTSSKVTAKNPMSRVGSNVVPSPKKKTTKKKATTKKSTTTKTTKAKSTTNKTTPSSRKGMTAGQRAKQAGKEKYKKGSTKKKTGYVKGSAFKRK